MSAEGLMPAQPGRAGTPCARGGRAPCPGDGVPAARLADGGTGMMEILASLASVALLVGVPILASVAVNVWLGKDDG